MYGRKNILVLTAVLLAALMAAGPVWAAGGQVFSDVKTGAWYEQPIAELKAKGLVDGTGGGKFSPQQQVTVQEAVVFLGKLLGWDNGDTAIPSSFFEGDKVPDWAAGYIAAAIREEVIAGPDLYLDPTEPAKRYEVAIFAVKALGLDSRARGRSGAELEFTDAADIKQEIPRAVGYIDVAVEEGILAGDANGAFKAKNGITRAEIAVVLSRLEKKARVARDNVVKGEVFGIHAAENALTIRRTDGEIVRYDITSNAFLYSNGEKVAVDGFAPLESVSLVLNDAGDIVYAEIIDEEELAQENISLEGELTTVDADTPSLTIETDAGREVTYDVADDAELRLDYKECDFEDLVAGQAVEVQVEGGIITQVLAESFESTVEGVVVRIDYGADTTIVVTLEDETESSYVVDEDVDIDGDANSLREIFAGQEVELDLENNIVINIDVTSLDDEVEGTVSRIVLAAEPEVVVNVDGVERTFTFARNANLEKDGDDIEVSDLRVGDYVELDITGSIITNMEVTAKVVADYLIGEIENINDSAEVIILKEINKPIYLTDDTVILRFGDSVSLRHLDPEDEIFAVGQLNSGILEADTIVVISSSE